MFNLLLVTAYLVSSIPFNSLLVSHVTGIDLMTRDTKITGIANTFRNAPLWVGFAGVFWQLLLLCIFLVWIPMLLPMVRWQLFLLLSSLILGNIFPIFHDFKGSKGRTLLMWGLLYLAPWLLIVLLIAWGLAFFMTKRSPVGVKIAAVALPVFVFLIEQDMIIATIILLMVIPLQINNHSTYDDFKYLQKEMRD